MFGNIFGNGLGFKALNVIGVYVRASKCTLLVFSIHRAVFVFKVLDEFGEYIDRSFAVKYAAQSVIVDGSRLATMLWRSSSFPTLEALISRACVSKFLICSSRCPLVFPSMFPSPWLVRMPYVAQSVRVQGFDGVDPKCPRRTTRRAI